MFGENGTKVTANLTLTARWTEAKKPEPKSGTEARAKAKAGTETRSGAGGL